MFTLVFLSLLAITYGVSTSMCTAEDHAIFRRIGHTFEHVFRPFGGVTVSKRGFEMEVTRAVGLSESCASCYGDSYICGWDNCKRACIFESTMCTACLVENQCVERCRVCTGFY